MENTVQYEQLKKNSVKAERQLAESRAVRFENLNGTGPRILFAGNSITLHGIKPDIGWHNEWGMAASSKEKDYVHCVMRAVKEIHSDAAFCICQISEWERCYKDASAVYVRYQSARDFEADIIVFRAVENCLLEGFDADAFQQALREVLAFLDPKGNAKIILTTSFWKHPGDEWIAALAEERSLPLINLGDLGERDEMKALGLFEHAGVANHPGDLGMKTIAERVLAVLKTVL